MNPDFSAIAAALEHQLSVLAPVSGRLRMTVVHPPVAPPGWRGPASAAFDALEVRLRAQLRRASDAAETALHATRRAAADVATLAQAQLPHV